MNKKIIDNIKESLSGDELEDFNFLIEEYNNLWKAYNILMDWFDYIPEEDREEVSKQLEECGL